jgi:flagellar protein FlaG
MDIGSIKDIPTPVAVAPKTERNAPEETAIISDSEVNSDAPASREEIEAAVATIQDFAQTARRDLNFTLEEGSGRVVVKVTDARTGDLIRQIPSEEALQLAEDFSEVRSLLFKAEA